MLIKEKTNFYVHQQKVDMFIPFEITTGMVFTIMSPLENSSL